MLNGMQPFHPFQLDPFDYHFSRERIDEFIVVEGKVGTWTVDEALEELKRRDLPLGKILLVISDVSLL